MPTYQYACTACDEQIEVVQRFADAPLTDCPSCSGRLRKVFSPVGVVFKGSGFYKTDSRSSGKGGSNGRSADTSAEKPADKSAEKPAEKSAGKPAETSKSDSAASGTPATPAAAAS